MVSDEEIYELVVVVYKFMTQEGQNAAPISLEEFREKLQGLVKNAQ